MRICQVTPGNMEIPPKGWGAIEKIIWDYKLALEHRDHQVDILYLNTLTGGDLSIQNKYDVIHIHMANLAIQAKNNSIPYIFTCHDHHTYIQGKDSYVYKENLRAMEGAILSIVPAKYLVDFFNNIPLYLPHGVNTDLFKPKAGSYPFKLLCVGHNGIAGNQAFDRKGFGFAIRAARKLDLPITIAGPNLNNKKFFNENPDLANYDKLDILYDVTEPELLELYQSHYIFLHPSSIEAGHPNLTLLESLACGTPIVGTYEDDSLDGLIKCERADDSVIDGIKIILDNYDHYSEVSRESSLKYTWDKVCKRLNRIYETTIDGDFMLENLNRLYNDISKRDLTVIEQRINEINIVESYTDGPKIEIIGNEDKQFLVEFIDAKTNNIIYSDKIYGNMWSTCSRKWYVDWKIVVKDIDGNLVYETIFDLNKKNVLIDFESSSIGDTLAWIPYVDKFRKKHNCNIYCATEWNQLFEEQYKEINFINKGSMVDNIYAIYRLGWWFSDLDWHPRDVREIPLQQSASDILGLEYKEIKINITIPDKSRTIDEPYVCIGIHGTSQCKYWNHKGGWQKVVDYLNKQGYKVVLISKEYSFGQEQFMNHPPENIIDKTGDYSIEDRIIDLNYAEYYIGIGSGLSWLAWAVGTPTILISSMSEPWHEFTTNSIRVYRESQNSGFWNNSEFIFDRGEWNWNPIKKMESLDDWNNFEPISYEDVKLAIDKIDAKISTKVYCDDVTIYTHPKIVNWTKSNYKEIFTDKCYDKIVEVNEGDVVVDVGANLGIFTIYSWFKNAKKVYSIEPSSFMIKYLKLNTNQFSKNIELSKIAISSKEETADLQMTGFYEGGVLDIVEKTGVTDRPNVIRTEKIRCISMDMFIEENNIDVIDFLKIDIEGSEYELFKGISDNNLKYKVKKISGEYHWNYNNQLENIFTKLDRCGFKYEFTEINSHFKIGMFYAYNTNFKYKKRLLSLPKTKDHTKYKVKLVHLLTRPEDTREQASIKSLEALKDYDIDYIQHINEPYTGIPPYEKAFPSDSSEGRGDLGPGHYGAWTSFKRGVIEGFSDDIDFLILCECDCILTVKPEKFIKILNEACKVIKEKDIWYFSFGDRILDGTLQSPIWDTLDDNKLLYQTYKIIHAHCVLISKKAYPYLLQCYEKFGWDSPDIWFNHVFTPHPLVGKANLLPKAPKIGILWDSVAIQSEGDSLIDYLWKEEDRMKIDIKKALITFGSGALGDNIGWIPYCLEYKKKFNVDEVVVSTHYNYLFESVYPELTFVNPGETVYNFNKRHHIDFAGLTLKEEEMYDNPQPLKDYKECSVQGQATNCLGLEYKEIKPRIVIPDKPRRIKEKYVCIAIQSTVQAKYWNLSGGWKKIIKYLKKQGYKVICIDRHKQFGIEGRWNTIPHQAIDRTGNFSLEDRIIDIKYADMFIGTSSGLAWIAWAVGTPVVMISGFTKPWNEFTTGVERVHNDNVCNGCWNTHQFDISNWIWCPERKNFECSKKISVDMVKDSINKVKKK